MHIQTFSNRAVKITVETASDLNNNLHQADTVYLFVPTTLTVDLKQLAHFTFIDTHVMLRKQTLLPKSRYPQIEELQTVSSEIQDCARDLSKYSRLAKDPNIPQDMIEDIYANWLDSCKTFVYMAAGNVAGYISLKDSDITMLYVAPQYRGSGIATELIKHVDHPDLHVATLLSNIPALNFYFRTGFVLEKTFNVFHYHHQKKL